MVLHAVRRPVDANPAGRIEWRAGAPRARGNPAVSHGECSSVVERRTVAPDVAGSTPVTHPTAGRVRRILDERGTLVFPGVYDTLSAKIAERAGFPLAFISGYAVSATLIGEPDMGLLTQTEIVERARQICGAVTIPIVVDADTGYGNALNVVRTVRGLLDAGAAGCFLEDQAWPKRCGHLRDKAGHRRRSVAPEDPGGGRHAGRPRLLHRGAHRCAGRRRAGGGAGAGRGGARGGRRRHLRRGPAVARRPAGDRPAGAEADGREHGRAGADADARPVGAVRTRVRPDSVPGRRALCVGAGPHRRLRTPARHRHHPRRRPAHRLRSVQRADRPSTKRAPSPRVFEEPPGQGRRST